MKYVFVCKGMKKLFIYRVNFRVNNLGIKIIAEIGSNWEGDVELAKLHIDKSKEKLPITDDVAKKIVTIPIHPRLSDKDVDHIIKTINSSIK